MKVSELIKDIVNLAEQKFMVDPEHPEDAINVCMRGSDLDGWCICLERPSQRQLDRGYVAYSQSYTIRLCEVECRFYCQADTLMTALHQLMNKVSDALDWNDENAAV